MHQPTIALEVFEGFANDSRVTRHVNKSNGGNPFVQWNKGMALASGQYIWIAESDDFAETTFLEMMIAGLGATSNSRPGHLSLNHHGSTRSGSGSVRCLSLVWRSGRWKNDYFNSGIAEIENYLAFQNTIPNASATLIKRDAFNRI